MGYSSFWREGALVSLFCRDGALVSLCWRDGALLELLISSLGSSFSFGASVDDFFMAFSVTSKTSKLLCLSIGGWPFILCALASFCGLLFCLRGLFCFLGLMLPPSSLTFFSGLCERSLMDCCFISLTCFLMFNFLTGGLWLLSLLLFSSLIRSVLFSFKPFSLIFSVDSAFSFSGGGLVCSRSVALPK